MVIHYVSAVTVAAPGPPQHAALRWERTRTHSKKQPNQNVGFARTLTP